MPNDLLRRLYFSRALNPCAAKLHARLHRRLADRLTRLTARAA